MWGELVQHTVTGAVVVFCGYGLAWIGIRLFGRGDGIITQAADRATETMERNSKTLSELKDLNEKQQTLCTLHAGSMKSLEDFSDQMIQLHTDPNSTFATVGIREQLKEIDETAKDVKEHVDVAAQYQQEISQSGLDEFRVIPALDAMMAACDTCGRVASHCNTSEKVAEEITKLKSSIVEIKAELRREKEK